MSLESMVVDLKKKQQQLKDTYCEDKWREVAASFLDFTNRSNISCLGMCPKESKKYYWSLKEVFLNSFGLVINKCVNLFFI